MSNRTITINNWSDEHSDEEALSYVMSQISKGYTCGHDSGLYWEIRESDPAKEAGPKLLRALLDLQAWAKTMGGWEAKVWKNATKIIKEAQA